MDSIIANALLSNGSSNLHIEYGTMSSTTNWSVSGYQDSSCALVAAYISAGNTLSCIVFNDSQVYRVIKESGIRNYGMSVTFTSSGEIAADMTEGGDAAYATAYLIIGIP